MLASYMSARSLCWTSGIGTTLEDNPPPLILDEIQQAPELLVYLKLAIDRDRDSCGQFLLTGSQTFSLMTNAGEPPRLYHWRTVSGNEVDFVFEAGGRVHGMECKLTSSPRPGQVKSLERFMALLPQGRRGNGFLICLRDRNGRLGAARVVPLQHFRKLHRLENLLV